MKRKQDEAAMTAADREALEVAEIRAQFGPLFDLYSACIDLVEERGPECVPDNLHDALFLAVSVRKELGLAEHNETKALAALRPANGG